MTGAEARAKLLTIIDDAIKGGEDWGYHSESEGFMSPMELLDHAMAEIDKLGLLVEAHDGDTVSLRHVSQRVWAALYAAGYRKVDPLPKGKQA